MERGSQKVLDGIRLREDSEFLLIKCWNCRRQKGIMTANGGIYCLSCGAFQYLPRSHSAVRPE